MSSAKQLPLKNPRHLQLAYLSYFVVQSLDSFLFITLHPQLFKDRSILSGPTQFFIRSNAVTLFPFILLVFLLRKHHVSSDIGRKVAKVFTLFHTLALGLIFWARVHGPWHLEPFWASVGFHGAWCASGAAALMGY